MGNAVENLSNIAKSEKNNKTGESGVVSVWVSQEFRHVFGATEIGGAHPNDKGRPRFKFELQPELGQVKVTDTVSGKTRGLPLGHVALYY